jgi:hypothetical protein
MHACARKFVSGCLLTVLCARPCMHVSVCVCVPHQLGCRVCEPNVLVEAPSTALMS